MWTWGHVQFPHQFLAATLTLSQPEGADYADPILMSTPSFEDHRRACVRYLLYETHLSHRKVHTQKEATKL